MRVWVWVFGLMAAAVFAAMQIWTLPHLTALGGAPPFDLRLTGYSMADAQALLTSYGPQGRAYYLDVQQRLDMVLPAVLGLTLLLGLRRHAPQKPALALLPALFVAADYSENVLLRRILRAGPDVIDATTLHWASLATQTKFASLILAILAFSTFLALATRRRA